MHAVAVRVLRTMLLVSLRCRTIHARKTPQLPFSIDLFLRYGPRALHRGCVSDFNFMLDIRIDLSEFSVSDAVASQQSVRQSFDGIFRNPLFQFLFRWRTSGRI